MRPPTPLDNQTDTIEALCMVRSWRASSTDPGTTSALHWGDRSQNERSSAEVAHNGGRSPMVDWERNWRGNGVIAAVLFIVSYVIYGSQPKVGASAEKLVSFYDGDRTRILIASVVFGFAILCLMWFAAALASVLRDAGKGGWGRAATAASAAIGAVYFVLITLWSALAYSIAGSANDQVTSALNDVTWVLHDSA